MTERNKYQPTAAEKKLLEVLINPEYVGKSVTAICKDATVSRKKYYDAMSKEDFRNLVNQTTMDLIKGKASDVLNATYKYAMKEKGHQDRKMILNIAGIYVEKRETELSGNIDISGAAKEIESFFDGDDSS
ncbi:phBC6A51 family helix-turn-helix protein [Enterococcus sp. AZ103]|uniref:phBC6A51 family helix-turn-helix protein n=1 Tax=Enterococcus sp. AZ103 TaxID=2774628 RepID=UPI003F22DBB2